MANLWRKIALTGVTATVAIAFNIIGAKPASAQTSVRCESIDYEYNECPLDTRGGVTLEGCSFSPILQVKSKLGYRARFCLG
jgi:hypothetical protein